MQPHLPSINNASSIENALFKLSDDEDYSDSDAVVEDVEAQQEVEIVSTPMDDDDSLFELPKKKRKIASALTVSIDDGAETYAPDGIASINKDVLKKTSQKIPSVNSKGFPPKFVLPESIKEQCRDEVGSDSDTTSTAGKKAKSFAESYSKVQHEQINLRKVMHDETMKFQTEESKWKLEDAKAEREAKSLDAKAEIDARAELARAEREARLEEAKQRQEHELKMKLLEKFDDPQAIINILKQMNSASSSSSSINP